MFHTYILFSSRVLHHKSHCEGPLQPLIVDRNFAFPRPVKIGSPRVRFAANENFWIACPGGAFNVSDLDANGELVTCLNGRQLQTQRGTIINFNTISCTVPQNDRSGLIDHVYEVNDAANTCEREFIQIDVGYCIAQNNFVRVLTYYLF